MPRCMGGLPCDSPAGCMKTVCSQMHVEKSPLSVSQTCCVLFNLKAGAASLTTNVANRTWSLASLWESVELIFHSIPPFYDTLIVALCTLILWHHLQHQDRKGEEGTRTTARNDQDGNQWGGNRRGDGEGEEILPAPDVWGQSDGDGICVTWSFDLKSVLKENISVFNVFSVST